MFSSIFSSVVLGWPERGNHLFARQSAFKGPLRSLPIHTPDRLYGHVSLGLTNRRELTQTHLETFHPFTHISLGANIENETSCSDRYFVGVTITMRDDAAAPIVQN